MKRRTFLCGLTLGALAPLDAEAQQAETAATIGVIGPGPSRSDQAGETVFFVFRERLKELGHIESRNVRFVRRWPEYRYERLQQLAQDLTSSRVDVIAAWSTPAVTAAKRATTTIPIVMASSADAVATGLVESLSHPGGNVTGVSWQLGQLATKWLQMIIELRPRAKRILVLWDSTNLSDICARPELQSAAKRLKTSLDFVEARGADDCEMALRAGVEHGASGVIVFPNVRSYFLKERLAEAALKNRLPTVHGFREFVDAGGLLAYTPSRIEMARQTAGYVDRIIKGAKPADLPVEQPTKFELVINMKTAKALGLTIPPSLLLRADEVIQ